MATKKNKKAAEKAAPAVEEKVKKTPKKAETESRKKMTEEEKAAKKAARKEALKNRPAGQRTNSKQFDVIELSNGCKVLNYGYPVRNGNVLIVTSVLVDAEGNTVSVSTSVINGNLTIKSKKGHGIIKVAKAKAGAEEPEDAEEDDDDDED